MSEGTNGPKEAIQSHLEANTTRTIKATTKGTQGNHTNTTERRTTTASLLGFALQRTIRKGTTFNNNNNNNNNEKPNNQSTQHNVTQSNTHKRYKYDGRVQTAETNEGQGIFQGLDRQVVCVGVIFFLVAMEETGGCP